ncbi:MAG: hypothetical protein ACTSX8_03210 [Alphaproteobacteria bacterium]
MPQGYQPTIAEAHATVDVEIANGCDVLIQPSPLWGPDVAGVVTAEAQRALALVLPVSEMRNRVEDLIKNVLAHMVNVGAIVTGADGLWHLEGVTIFKVQMPLASNDPEPKALIYNASRSSSAMVPVDDTIRDAMQDRPKAFFYGQNIDHATADGCIEQLCEVNFDYEAPEQDW